MLSMFHGPAARLALLAGAFAVLTASGCVTRTQTVSMGTIRSIAATIRADGEAEVFDRGGDRLVLRATQPIASVHTLVGDVRLSARARLLGDALALCSSFSAEACPLRRATAIDLTVRELSWPHVWMYAVLVALNGIAGVGAACGFGALGCDDYSASTRTAIGTLSILGPLALVSVILLDSMGR